MHSRNKCRKGNDNKSQQDYNRCIDAGKLPDKKFRRCFPFRRILNLSPDVKREFKKLYVAYKLDTNFADIIFMKQRLRISVNMKFAEVIDPKGICRDVTGLGRWGNGDVELSMEHISDTDQVMEIIEQSFKLQADSD